SRGHQGVDEDGVWAHRAVGLHGDAVWLVQVVGFPDEPDEVVAQVSREPKVLGGRSPGPQTSEEVPEPGRKGVIWACRSIAVSEDSGQLGDAVDQEGWVLCGGRFAVDVVERHEPQE